MQSIFDIIAGVNENQGAQRIVVYVDKPNRTIYTWNESLTLQAWQTQTNGAAFVETDCSTLSDIPASFAEAHNKVLDIWYPAHPKMWRK